MFTRPGSNYLTSGLQWTPVDSSGLQWTPVDSSVASMFTNWQQLILQYSLEYSEEAARTRCRHIYIYGHPQKLTSNFYKSKSD